MPVTSLPIYGLRKRAGPGGFGVTWLICKRARLRGLRRARDSRLEARGYPRGSGARGRSRSSGARRRAWRGGGARWVPLRPLGESERVRAAARPPGAGRNSGSPGLSKKGEDPVPAAPPPQPLFGSHSGKLNFGKKPSEAETLQSNPYSLSWQLKTASTRRQRRRRRKKKSFMHSRKLTAFF